ncbi:MAG: hypothetical protein WCW65_00160 [Candidatus Paceibacterota bacterium]
MIGVFLWSLYYFLTGQKPAEKEESSDGFTTVEDVAIYDLTWSKIDLFHPVGKTTSARTITGEELMKQIKAEYPLGEKNRDDYFNYQEMIPEEFKGKTLLFAGTKRQKYEKFFIPSLEYHDIRGVWSKGNFCLSDNVSLHHNCVPVFKGNISN